MGWFLRDAPWQASLLVGLGLLGFAGYRLAGHQGGPSTWVMAGAGVFAVVRSLLRARSGGSGR